MGSVVRVGNYPNSFFLHNLQFTYIFVRGAAIKGQAV